MPSPPEGHKPNRLIDETSPYLLQHAYNPVEWYPWGPEALERAKAEDKLILLSIGYSACHWCHVMERESFENESIAAKMNAHYVNIKVDREERPDIDDIYMAATVVMNAGQGGWPMTVILTPDLEPVFAGTYFPPDDSHGRAGFPRILSEIDRVWHGDRERVIGQARQFAEQLRNHRDLGPALTVGVEQLVLAGRQLTDSFDPIFGGFGGAPKFPPSMGVRLLMRLHRRFGEPHFLHMAVHTLERMAAGGLYDHVGGGFCRYATDKKWLVPHFEKMLYDNALLVPAYLEAFQITKHDHFRQVARETLDYILREMTGDHGGFFTATDADSEGEEGKFFVWQPDEVDQILEGDEATFFKTYYDITPSGNWEGKSIPNTPKTIEECAKGMGISAERARELTNTAKRKVYEARLRRVPPGLDDKVLTAWNGLMIGALADGYRVIGEPAYLVAAERAADFLRTTLVGSDGRLLRTYRLGKAHLPGYLEDYAYLINGLIDLYEAGGALRHLVWAKQLVHTMLQAFGDLENGAFFHTAVGQEDLIMRYRDGSDGATPSPNAMAALALVRLSRHTDDRALRDAGVRALRAYGRPIAQFARGFSTSLMVVDMLLEEPLEIAVAAHGDWEAWRTELAEHFLPNRVQAIIPLDQEDDATWPLRTGKVPVGGQSTAYVCRNFSCEAPLTDPSDFAGVLQESTGRSFATISRSIAGFATKEGTRGFADRFAMPGYRALGSTELTVSVVGFGGYRVDDVVDTHREALERAMASGINVIDTSSNYVDGASERLAGSVVRSMIDEGDIARDELVIVSKLGYLQGQNYRAAEERERREQAYPEVVKVQEGLWHSIHPVVLADQLAGSLARLEIETLDVCLLHNPEYFLNNDDDVMRTLTDRRNEFYRRVTEAFRFFESAVHEGQIRCYGVSSNTLAFSDDAPDSVSLAALIECAEHAAGNTHHFRVIQLPLNVLESAAAISENSGPERNVSTLTYAQHQGLGVLVNRPLNAFRESMYRLADVTVLGVPIDIDVQADKLLRLEESFLTAIGGANAAAMGLDAEVEDAFHWGEELRSLGLHPLSIEQWAHIAGQVQRSVARASSMLDRRMNPEESSPWLEWRDRYFTALGVMLGELRRRAAELGHRQTQAIAATIDPVLPSSVHHESLSRKALWIVASTPGVSCVLNGMRTPEYVRDAAGVMEWDILPDPYAAYRALGDWRGT